MIFLTVDVEPDFPPHYESFGGIEGLEKIVDRVRHYKCGATFFVCARLLEENPGLTDVLDGFELGCHGLEHVDYSRLDRETVRKHFAECENIFENHGVDVAGFRAPYASVNQAVLEEASKHFKYDSSKNFWSSGAGEFREFPLFTGGKFFGVHPLLFKSLLLVPVENKVFFTHPWEYGGMDFEKIMEKRGWMRLLGYSSGNYLENLETLLKQETHCLREIL
jgi:peptidoglycan/xylan/chitin deacetylase (PgdA/CDA1 family)